MVSVGVDPGLSGSICFFELYDKHVEFYDIPILKVGTRREYDIGEIRGELAFRSNRFPLHLFIEKMQPMPAKMGGSIRNFSVGVSRGMWDTLAVCLNVPRTLVPPQAWKKAMMAGMGKE